MSLRRRALAGWLAVAAFAVAAQERAPCPVVTANLFPAQTWLPPPAPVVPRKPEPPRAPPLPFAYLGQLQEGDRIAIFLGLGQSTHIVRGGDTVAGAYRVEQITPERATFVYLPLNESQHLTLRTRP